MKKVLLFATAVALMLGACSNDDVIDSGAENTGSAIEFRTVSGEKSTLRAAITDTDNILSFTVTGWWEAPATGNTAGSDFLFNAFGITRGEDNSNEWSYSPVMYWPTSGTVDFYAYSPASSRNLSVGLAGYKSGDSITYTVPVIKENNAQEDFLVAQNTAIKADTAKGTSATVTFNFHHALSRVKFYGVTTREDITYIIDTIKLVNLYQTADFDLDSIAGITQSNGTALDYTNVVQPWKNHAMHNALTNYVVDMGGSPIYLKYSDPASLPLVYTSLLGETNAILVMPQTTGIFDGKVFGTAAPATTNTFAIAVSYKAFGSDGTYYAGNANRSEVKYFAVPDPRVPTNPITFEMGRQYAFYLKFGEEAGNSIAFALTVQGWNDPLNP